MIPLKAELRNAKTRVEIGLRQKGIVITGNGITSFYLDQTSNALALLKAVFVNRVHPYQNTVIA